MTLQNYMAAIDNLAESDDNELNKEILQAMLLKQAEKSLNEDDFKTFRLFFELKFQPDDVLRKVFG